MSSASQKERTKRSRLEKTLKEIMAENGYINLIRDIHLDIQEAEQNTNRINPKRFLPTLIIIRLLKNKTKKKSLESRQRKMTCYLLKIQ